MTSSVSGASLPGALVASEPIGEGVEYSLFGVADGSRFRLRYKVVQMAADLLGEDAVRFRADYETIKSQYPDWPVDQTLAQLWDQGGYSWLATSDGD